MKNGKITIKFDKGKITGVFLGSGIDRRYETLFESELNLINDEKYTIDNGIKIVIFGAFQIEALINLFLKEFLEYEIHNANFRKKLWDRLVRSTFHEKLDLISSRIDYKKIWKDNFKNRAEKLFDLRNRLAHFKDEEMFICKKIDASIMKNEKKYHSFVQSIPDHDLIKILSYPDILTTVENIKYIKSEIISCRKTFRKFKKIKTEVL